MNTKNSNSLKCWFASLTLLTLLTADLAQAQSTQYASGTFTWSNGGTGWSSTSGGPYSATWTSGNNAVFEGTAGTVTFSSPTAYNLTFNTTAYILGGNGNSSTLTLNGTSPTITLNVAAATIGYTAAGSSSIIAGSGGFTYNGLPTSILTFEGGQNTLTGGITINGGNLGLNWSQLGTTANIFPTGNTIAIGGSSTLDFLDKAANSTSQTFAGLTLNPGANIIGINESSGSGNMVVTAGPVTRNAGATVNITFTGGSGATHVGIASSTWGTSGLINDHGVAYATFLYSSGSTASPSGVGPDWATAASGTVANIVASTYTAITGSTITGNANVNSSQTYSSGTFTPACMIFNAAAANSLTLNSPATLTTGGILVAPAVAGNASTINGSGTLMSAATVANKDLVVINNDNNAAGGLTIGCVIADATAGATGLTKSGAGLLTLAGANTYTGPTYINPGKVSVSADNNLGTAPGSATPGMVVLNGGTLSASGTFTLNANRGMIVGLANNVGGGTLDVAAGQELDYGGIIANNGTGIGSLTKTSAGTLALSGASTYSGGTTLSAGQLNINYGGSSSANSAIGTGPLTISGGMIDNTSGADITMQPVIAQKWNGNFTYAGSANNLNLGTGSVAMNASRQVTVSAGTLTVGGIISGSTFSLTKLGSGTLALNGANTYTGNTTISAGTLAIGSGGSLAANSSVNIAAGATFDVSGYTGTSGTYTWGGGAGLTATGSATSGSANAAQLNAGASAIVDVSGRPLSLTFTPASTSGDSTHPSLNISAGTLNLNSGTTFTINNNGAALGNGNYTLISGNVTGTPTTSVITVGGSGLVANAVATLSVTGGNLVMNVQVVTPTAMTSLTRTIGNNPATYDDPLTFQAVISPDPGDGSIVHFQTNGTDFATTTTTGGTATLSGFTGLQAGSWTITASFLGSTNFGPCSTNLTDNPQGVNQLALTLTGATANNKMYDGGTVASISGGTLSPGAQNGDVLTVTNGTFASPGSATANTTGVGVTVNLGGSGAGNYSLTQPGLTADILVTNEWTNTASGNWGTGANWYDNVPASGSGNTADFSQVDITSDTTVHLDSPKTIGNLIFGNMDVSPNANWIVDNSGTLANTLTATNFTVNALGTGKAATISAVLAGNGGVNKTGPGTLVLSGANAGTGAITVNNGELDFGNWNAPSVGAVTVGNVAGDTGTLGITGGTLALGVNSFYLGNQPASSTAALGIVNQTSGTVSFNGGNGLLLGQNNSASSINTNTYNLSGGTMQSLGAFASASRGVMLGVSGVTTVGQNVSTFNLSGSGVLDFHLGGAVMCGRSDSTSVNTEGVYNQTGGSASLTLLTIGGGAANTGTMGTFSVTGGSFVTTSFPNLASAASSTATMMLGGSAQVILPAFPAPSGTATLTLDFTTGYLSPYAASTTYLNGLTDCYLTANGAKFNVGTGTNITVAQPLLDAVSPAQSGTLTKTGNGTLTLSGVSTYTGNTTISAGTLALSGSGSINHSASISVASGGTFDVSAISGYQLNGGQTLTGNGVVSGAVTTASSAVLYPGIGGIGTLTFKDNLTLNANTTNDFVVTAGGGVSNKVAVVGQLTPNGSVVVIDTAGNAALGFGTNTLFTYGTISAPAFAATPVFVTTQTGPATNAVIVDNGSGQIQLIVPNAASLASNPTNVSYTVTGKSLNLTWPADHQGWLVQSNSVNLSVPADWYDISNTATGTNYSITLDPEQKNVFYRLRHP